MKPHRYGMMMCVRWAERVFGNRIFNAQVAIMGILGTLVVGMTVGIWFQTSRHGTSQVNQFAHPLIEMLMQRTAACLLHMADSHYDALLALESILQSDLVTSTKVPETGDLWSDNQVLNAMWPILSTREFLLSSLYVSKTEGDIVTLIRSVQGELWGFVQNNTRNNTDFQWYGRQYDVTTDKVMGPIMVYNSPFRDLRLYPSYVHIKNQTYGVFIYDEVVPPDFTALVMGTHLLAGGPNGNQTDSVIFTSMSLTALSDYIGSLDLLGGVMYVANKLGQVLAVTPGVNVTGRDVNIGTPILIPATKINHSVISGAAQYLERKLGFEAVLERPQHLSDVRIGRRKYYVESTPVKWNSFLAVVVIIVPRSSILGMVDRGMKMLAIFLFVLGSGTLIVGQVLVILLTRYMSSEVKLKKILARKQEAKETAEACSSSARLFLANLSHDLRIPMTAVVNILGMVGACEMDADIMTLVDQVQGSASTLHSLISSVLDISEMESGELELNLAPLNITAELQTLVDNFSIEASSTGVDVLLDLPARIPLVLGDKMRIHQIFSNLLSNCVKFTTEGHVIIRGSVATVPADDSSEPDCQRSTGGRAYQRWATDLARLSNSSYRPSEHHEGAALGSNIHIAFEVEDTGRGVPQDHKELLFENFVSSPDNHSRYGGTGVGLGIVRSLVNIMGGTIAAREKEDCGASFAFSLIFPLAWADCNVLPLLSEPPPEKYDGLVTLAMPRGMQSDITSAWLIAHGLELLPQETSWEGIPSAADSMWTLLKQRCFMTATVPFSESSSGLHQSAWESCVHTLAASLCATIIVDVNLMSENQDDFFLGSGLPKFLERLQRSGTVGGRGSKPQVAVAWACHPSISIEARQALHLAGCFVARKPLVASRLSALLAEIYMSVTLSSASESPPISLLEAATATLLSQPGLHPSLSEEKELSPDTPTIPNPLAGATALQMSISRDAKDVEDDELKLKARCP